ncbi:hypothetical protein ACJRO7_034988 [Eucalyptus globulus]|uniref:DC1 domain-containing protein n=1 Tax=Eucalyptus globulus TaxID=34317 RepID=A0ABD3J7N6_EUCGL
MRYDEITHPSHRHNLKPEDNKILFKCDGCKEDGIGLCYRCDKCKFDLHFHCAITSERISLLEKSFQKILKLTKHFYQSSLDIIGLKSQDFHYQSHPCYPNCSFQFKSKPPEGRLHQCNACGKDVNGFFYRCQDKKGVNLHPCCANLPEDLDDGKVKIILYMNVRTSCLKCNKERRSWVYRTEDKRYTLHVACAREMLVERWWNGDGGTRRGLLTEDPCSKDKLQAPHKMSESKKKWWKMLRLALQFLMSAVVGDPTSLVVGVFGSLMS